MVILQMGANWGRTPAQERGICQWEARIPVRFPKDGCSQTEEPARMASDALAEYRPAGLGLPCGASRSARRPRPPGRLSPPMAAAPVWPSPGALPLPGSETRSGIPWNLPEGAPPFNRQESGGPAPEYHRKERIPGARATNCGPRESHQTMGWQE